MSDEERRWRALIVAQYECDDDDDDVGGGGCGGGGGGDGLDANNNKADIGTIEAAKRDAMKAAHEKKTKQDRESTAKAKADREEKKGKATQKKEKQRAAWARIGRG